MSIEDIDYLKKKIHNEKMRVYTNERYKKYKDIIVVCEYCNKEYAYIRSHKCKGKLMNEWKGISEEEIDNYLKNNNEREKRKKYMNEYMKTIDKTIKKY